MTEKLRILVVDDEKVVRDGCRRVLTGKGYEIEAVENGKEALDSLAGGDVDIVLLDLKMPVMGGEEVLERVSAKYPHLPVIIITGHGTVDTAVECMKNGAYDFITKPFQIDQFLITIKRAADKIILGRKARQLEEQNARNLYDLALEKGRLKTIINRMATGIMVTNRNLEVVLHNPAFLRLMDISIPLSGPAPISEIIHDESLINTLLEIQKGDTGTDESIAQEIHMDGTVLRAISASAPGPDNVYAGTVTVLEDITAFKQLDEMKSDFVNMVAHELRSPLVSIRQFNTVMLEGLAGPMAKKQLEFTKKGTKKIDTLLALINDLLDVAKIDAGKYVQHLVPTDVGEIMDDIAALMKPRAESKGIALTCSYNNLVPIQADPKNIEEILNNLVTNAMNYSPEGGHVSVTAEARGEYVEIKVQDNGIGISSEELPKVFDKFYRVKNPKTRDVTGTGLGLSIVKGIVEALNGTIGVESEVNNGTTFKILLPAII